jgi:hypothetical protein
MRDEKASTKELDEIGRVPHVRQSVHPDFLSRLSALANFMRLDNATKLHRKSGQSRTKAFRPSTTRQSSCALASYSMFISI